MSIDDNLIDWSNLETILSEFDKSEYFKVVPCNISKLINSMQCTINELKLDVVKLKNDVKTLEGMI